MPDRGKHKFDLEDNFVADALTYALNRSFKDFNFRTLETKKDDKGKPKKPSQINGKNQTVTEYLIQKLKDDGFLTLFVNYFTNTALKEQTAFDKWHRGACEKFLDVLNDTELYEGKIPFGKAQKIVNMMFKHLYCLNGADKYADHFKYCHVTLDNFTLEWFKRNIPPYKRTDSWSNLKHCAPTESSNPLEDPKEYMFYQHNIQKYFSEDNQKANDFAYRGLTPFQTEFYIWPEIQLHLAAEAVFFNALDENTACELLENESDRRIKQKIEECTKNNLERLDYTRSKKIFKALPIDLKMSVLSEVIKKYKEYKYSVQTPAPIPQK